MKKKIIIIVLALIIAIGGGTYLYIDGTSAVSNKSEEVIFVVKSGDSATTIVTNLKKAGLVKSAEIAKIWARINNPKININTYALNKNMSVKEIFDAISDKSSKYIVNNRLTIKEGATIPTVAKEVATALNVEEDEVIEKWADQTYLKKLINKYWFLSEDILNENILYPLEGYIYPETYFVSEHDSTIESLTTIMLDKMDEKLSDYKKKINNSDFSTNELITLTSIVEKESKYKKDKAIIAGVFINRLNADMALQSDITVNYALQRTGVNVSTRMTQTQSLYNTYLHKGLPVGAVSNIHIDTLKAVLNYEKTDYYYFFAKEDGSVIYSKTYAEHQKVVTENKWY